MWFVPSSALTDEQRKTMPQQVALRMPDALHRVVKLLSNDTFFAEYSTDDLIFNEKQIHFSNTLASLFAEHGSDKSTSHNYHLIYGSMFALFNSPPRILEIGLGTNNPAIASNMGISGKPGASLRAFKAFSPQSIVDGADIDDTIKVDGCRVFTIDQTQPKTFDVIKRHGEVAYDIIIDDGLHSPDANLYTLEFALGAISDNGIIVIEDINSSAVDIWKIVRYSLLSAGFSAHIIKTKSAFMFIASKNKSFPKFNR
jgi:hypothetical protein